MSESVQAFRVDFRLICQTDKRWVCEAEKVWSKELFQFTAYSPSLAIIQAIEFFGTSNIHSINVIKDAE